MEDNKTGLLYIGIAILFVWIWHLQSDLKKVKADATMQIDNLSSQVSTIETKANEAEEKASDLETRVEEVEANI